MTDISTTYLGLRLRSPLVASPSPLWESIENIRKAEEAGAGAIVLHSLFEEQITAEAKELDRYLVQGTESFPESLSYFPDLGDYRLGPEEYLEHIAAAKDATSVPIIGSLNGISTGGWVEYAKAMEKAGADAVELNIYYVPTRTDMTSQKVEAMYRDLALDVRKRIDVPVAAKIGPYFSSLPNLAKSLEGVGIEGLVLFNRFYQPDLDPDNMAVVPHLVLSTSEELRLRLRWVAILYGRIKPDMAVTGGVHSAVDAVKSIMAGASVAMMTSALLKNGIGHLRKVNDGIVAWMKRHEYRSLQELRGSLSQKSVPDPAAFERANYMKTLVAGEIRA